VVTIPKPEVFSPPIEERKTARGGLGENGLLDRSNPVDAVRKPGGGNHIGRNHAKNTFDTRKGGGKEVIVVDSHNFNDLIFPSLRLRIVTDDATNLLSILEESKRS
jgi:hypothetical protein